MRPEQFRAGIRAQDAGAVHLRNGAKAALDLFRLHAAFRGSLAWRFSRIELTERLLGYGNLRELRAVLGLKGTLFRTDPFPIYAGLVRRAGDVLLSFGTNDSRAYLAAVARDEVEELFER